MLDKDMSFEEVVSRVATKGGITEEGTKVIYDQFPLTAEERIRFNKEHRFIKFRTQFFLIFPVSLVL